MFAQTKTRNSLLFLTGAIKSLVGVAAGGAVGMLMFRTGGWRAASAAMGLGVAWGSTYERAVASTKSK